jgi:uncharacterized protein (DUF2267 family)
MKYQEFLNKVQQYGDIDNRDEAIRATQATVRTLAERVTFGEAKDFISQLPQELKSIVLQRTPQTQAQSFSVDEFVQRVALIEDQPDAKGRKHAEAVMHAIQEALDPGELADLKSQLPKDFNAMLEGLGENRPTHH